MKLRVFVESGDKRVFCGASDWPGWARGAKTEDAALMALIEYGARYKRSVGHLAAALTTPVSVEQLDIVTRLDGGSGTDFGVPSSVADFDREDLLPAELEHQIKMLRAAWKAFDAAASRATDKTLATGPRGGGRSLAKIREHVLEADRAYIGALGAKAPLGGSGWDETQTAFVEALEAKVRGELPEKGPRGGERWPARYAVRRSAWHALDHAWEIEDRTT